MHFACKPILGCYIFMDFCASLYFNSCLDYLFTLICIIYMFMVTIYVIMISHGCFV